jgi:protein disulfide-isomerase A1
VQGAEYEEFKSVALKTEDVPFVQTTDSAVAKAAGLEEPGISAVKNFVGGHLSISLKVVESEKRLLLTVMPFVGEARDIVTFTGSLKAAEIKTFVTAEKLPLTIEFTQGNSDKIFNSGIKKQVVKRR